MNIVQWLLWDTLLDQLWQQRNEIVHREHNKYNAVENKQLAERIEWYVTHSHELMAYYDQYLAQIDMSRLSQMGQATRRQKN